MLELHVGYHAVKTVEQARLADQGAINCSSDASRISWLIQVQAGEGTPHELATHNAIALPLVRVVLKIVSAKLKNEEIGLELIRRFFSKKQVLIRAPAASPACHHIKVASRPTQALSKALRHGDVPHAVV